MTDLDRLLEKPDVVLPSDRERPLSSKIITYRIDDLPPEERARYQPDRPTKADLLKAQEEGKRVDEVAAEFGKARGDIVRRCKRHGIRLNDSSPSTGKSESKGAAEMPRGTPSGVTVETVRQVIAKRLKAGEDITLRKIAADLGCSGQTVLLKCSTAGGWTQVVAEMKDLHLKATEETPVRPVQDDPGARASEDTGYEEGLDPASGPEGAPSSEVPALQNDEVRQPDPAGGTDMASPEAAVETLGSEADTVAPEPVQDSWVWIDPVPTLTQPVLRIRDDCLELNSMAVQVLSGVAHAEQFHVEVGYRGHFIGIKPAQPPEKTRYRVTFRKGSTAKLKGRLLLQALRKAGFSSGTFPARLEDGILVADTRSPVRS